MRPSVVYVYLCMQTYKVETMDKPDDIAYSGIALPYHLDMSGWMESPPGLTLLHCLESVYYVMLCTTKRL